MAEKTNSPSRLRSLIVDSTGTDTDELLFRVLENRIAFEKSTGRLLPRHGLFELDWKQRLLLLLLARRARLRLEFPAASEQATAAELAAEAQVPIKTCREYLSRLKSTGLIERKGEGYALPDWNTLRAAEELSKRD